MYKYYSGGLLLLQNNFDWQLIQKPDARLSWDIFLKKKTISEYNIENILYIGFFLQKC